MSLSDGLQLYGAALTTLVILAGSIKYLISSRISPLEKRVESLSKGTDNLKQSLVDDIKEISQGNFEFRLKYEGAIKDLRLLLAEKFLSKEECTRIMSEINHKIEKKDDITPILNKIDLMIKEIKK
jgi:regulator of replication initiation timing